jgi:hypothetical protein
MVKDLDIGGKLKINKIWFCKTLFLYNFDDINVYFSVKINKGRYNFVCDWGIVFIWYK